MEFVLSTVGQDVLRVVFFGDDPGQVGFELEHIFARAGEDRLERQCRLGARLRLGPSRQDDTEEDGEAPRRSRGHEHV